MSQSPIHFTCSFEAGSLLAVVLALFVLFVAVLIWSRRERRPPSRRGRQIDDEPDETLPGDPADALQELRRRAGDGR